VAISSNLSLSGTARNQKPPFSRRSQTGRARLGAGSWVQTGHELLITGAARLKHQAGQIRTTTKAAQRQRGQIGSEPRLSQRD